MKKKKIESLFALFIIRSRAFSTLLFLLPFVLQSAEEIFVPLETTSPLSYLFVDGFKDEKSSFPADYTKRLREILLFDLDHTEATAVQEIASQEDRGSPAQFLSFLEGIGFSYLVEVKIDKDEISWYLTSTEKGALASYHEKLSGIFSADRRLIHKISDLIFEKITGKKGIATTQILYSMQTGEEKEGTMDWRSEIWIADYDGGNARQITEEHRHCVNPLFFPVEGVFTTGKFLYVNDKLGQSKLYLSTFGNPRGIPLLRLRGNQLLPTIASNGRKIAFISDASGEVDLFVQHFSPDLGPLGKPIQAFSFPHSVQASPTFSPDGTKIAFVSDKEGTPRIYLMDLRSLHTRKMASPTCLTKLHLENTSPAWSPDGTKIAYSAKIRGVRQIMLYDLEEKKEVQLTKGELHKESPCWAHNSCHLLFNTVSSSSSEIFLLHTKQKEAVQITNGEGRKHYPAWEPHRS